MADEKKLGKRDQVSAAIAEGKSTKAQIAEALGMSTGSVSSQMTYLRWQGKFIVFGEDKILKFVTEKEFNAWEAARAANRSTPVSKLTIEEQAIKVAKTIGNQEKSITTWEGKLKDAEEILKDTKNDENQDYVDECGANIVLLKIKLKRNKAKAKDLPAPVEPKADDKNVDADKNAASKKGGKKPTDTNKPGDEALL